MNWKRKTGKYQTGHDLELGKWIVGSTAYGSTRPKGSSEMWTAACFLPGLRNRIGHYKMEEEAKRQLEFVVGHWMEKANVMLTEKAFVAKKEKATLD